MRIKQCSVFHVCIPLKKEIRHASHVRVDTDSIVVCCEFDDGTLGWGEGLPREYVTGDSIESIWSDTEDGRWTEALRGEWGDLPEAVARLQRLDWIPVREGMRDCYGNSFRCAIELAVLDGLCRITERPLAAVTEVIPAAIAIRKRSDQVRYSTAITSMKPRKQWISAWKMRLWGFRQCKVKVGAEGIDDRASLSRIRRIVGPQVDLRLDANEAWSIDELVERMAELSEFGVTSLEQPVPHSMSDRLSDVRGQLNVPLMLDESLCSVSDAQHAVEHGTCDLFNIRLSKCGGLTRAVEIAAVAHRSGLGYQLGCQVGETAILSAAGRHFATSISGIRYLEGSYDKYLVRENLAHADITFGYGGLAPALTGHGLGVEVDPKALRRVTRKRQDWRIE